MLDGPPYGKINHYPINLQELLIPTDFDYSKPGYTGLGYQETFSSIYNDNGFTTINVWRYNFHKELDVIGNLVDQFNFIRVESQVSDLPCEPIGNFSDRVDHTYQRMRCNVDMVKLLRLSFVLSTEHNEYPQGIQYKWVFNFKFKISQDMYSLASVPKLFNGPDHLRSHVYDGIGHLEFAERLFGSGLVLSNNIFWKSTSGPLTYGFIFSILTNKQLPPDIEIFLTELKHYLPGADTNSLFSETIDGSQLSAYQQTSP
ncbi:ribonuclease H-like domain-containing protein [Dipodascopsis uninucleata]